MYYFIADSHHKLICWRIVTHGGIDGYSRLIVYLQCATNNKATTVYEQFLKAVQQHHLPPTLNLNLFKTWTCPKSIQNVIPRMRSDQGMENILVARHMIEKRGSQRCSMITGVSTHNQRTERLWRDMHKSPTILYYKLHFRRFRLHTTTWYASITGYPRYLTSSNHTS